jgi:uncharacterized protein
MKGDTNEVDQLIAIEISPPPPNCWLHPGVVVRPSPIEGNGLFASMPIAAGEPVSRLGGRVVTDVDLKRIFAMSDYYVDTVAIAEGLNLLLPPRQPSGYGNHGCDPNLWWSDAYTLIARRDIEPGEEVLNDYGTSTADPHWAMECSCGSPLCRGVVTGDDWRRHDLRERYGDHWAPVLLARIKGSAGHRAADRSVPLA